jgi:glyoxylase-like metal-dependent hydrolase (beta-lactamase superfamily II)
MRVIDLNHLGRSRVIGCWQVGEVLVDPGPGSCLDTLLEALDGWRPRALLLTHIHLDHAGASGSLVRRWPDLDVYVHERGARHMADPGRLLDSAQRLYGSDMDRLWGEFLPVPEENLRVLAGGETIEIEGMPEALQVAYTPGHASHHISYLHQGTAFVGDVGGVRITPDSLTVPPTPPPDIDLEAWHGSLDRLRSWSPERLAFTHFGSAEDVEAQLDELEARLDEWAGRAREQTLEEFMAWIRAEITAGAAPGTPPAFEQAAPPEQLYAGLRRYWQKREEAGAPVRGSGGSVS